MQTVEVPDTTRCVKTYPKADGHVTVVADHLSDILALQTEHMIQPGQCNLTVFINHVLKQDTDGRSSCAHTEGWLQTLNNLLETFRPAVVSINAPRTESGRQEDKFFMSLEDRTLYWCVWSADGTLLQITR